MKYESEGDQELQLSKLLNRGLVVQDNFNWGIVETALVVGENTVQHGLGFVPSGYIVIYQETVTVKKTVETGEIIVVGAEGNVNFFNREDTFFFVGELEGSSIISKTVDSSITRNQISGSNIELWTTEILFLTSAVASPRVRLFVL